MAVNSNRRIKIFFAAALSFLMIFTPAVVRAAQSPESEEFDAGEMIMHHIVDSYEWHFADHLVLDLPVLVYSPELGFKAFSSSVFHETEVFEGFTLDHGKLRHVDENVTVYDLSITKNVAQALFSLLLMIVIFVMMARSYKKSGNQPPKGIASVFEPIVVYIRDEIAIPNIGPKYERFMPYLLTLFFYIWFNNLLGLFPGGGNVTGNLAVTGVLALITFFITQINGTKNYWNHIFNTPGVPWWLKFPLPIMPLVELIGIFTKPFSLMVRLFANITAGHIIILSIISLIFIFKTAYMSLVSIPFAIFMNFLELLVGLLQAYIFTLLSAIYFGSAVEEHHEESHEEEIDQALI